jgi:hypothetical protein
VPTISFTESELFTSGILSPLSSTTSRMSNQLARCLAERYPLRGLSLKQAAEQVTGGGPSGLVADADADLSGAVCIPFVLQQGLDLASGDSGVVLLATDTAGNA